MASDGSERILFLLILYLVLCAFATNYFLTKGEWKKVRLGLPLAFAGWILLAVITLPSIEKPLESIRNSSLTFALLFILAVAVHPTLLYWQRASWRAIILMALAWLVLFGFGFLPFSFTRLAIDHPIRVRMDDAWMFVVMGLLVASFVFGVRDASRGISARK